VVRPLVGVATTGGGRLAGIREGKLNMRSVLGIFQLARQLMVNDRQATAF
jgi:hypothetical protein